MRKKRIAQTIGNSSFSSVEFAIFLPRAGLVRVIDPLAQSISFT
jgi:hypothetical protein